MARTKITRSLPARLKAWASEFVDNVTRLDLLVIILCLLGVLIGCLVHLLN